MTVTTSPFLTLGSFNLGTGGSSLMGQGTDPELWALWSFSDVQTDPPVWVNLDSTRVREFSVTRGRESELQDHDAGTATVTLANRDRAFDPTYTSGTYYPNVRPRNRVWLRGQFNGVTYDMFKGYVEAYQQQQPGPGQSDAQVVVQAADELKLLNTRRTNSFDPSTAGDYTAVVGADNPSHVWRWRDPFLTTTTVLQQNDYNQDPLGGFHWEWDFENPYGHFVPNPAATIEGPGWRSTGSGYGQDTSTPILGNETGAGETGHPDIFGNLIMSFSGTANQLTSTDQSAGDMQQSTKGTVEFWFKKDANPGADGYLWYSPEVTGVAVRLWTWQLLTTGAVRFNSRNSGGGTYSVASSALSSNQWYHLCAVMDGTNLTLYVNGVNVNSGAATLAWEQSSSTVLMGVQNPGTGVQAWFAEMAVYPGNGLSAARVLAHYNAGTQTGFSSVTAPGTRVGDTLDMVANHSPRSVQAGDRDMTAQPSAARPALDHVRAAVSCEKPDGLFFCGQDGKLIFLAADHRNNPPYSTTQVTFSDAASPAGVPYTDLQTDYTDSWLANIWNVSKAREDMVMQTASNAASISSYDELEQTISGLPIRANSDALVIAQLYLAKYKDPMIRGNTLSMDSGSVDCTDAFLSLELADRIRVVRTIPLGLGTFDQVMWIQKIEVSGSNSQGSWQMRLGVSPL